jgi:hypothetical protein
LEIGHRTGHFQPRRRDRKRNFRVVPRCADHGWAIPVSKGAVYVLLGFPTEPGKALCRARVIAYCFERLTRRAPRATRLFLFVWCWRPRLQRFQRRCYAVLVLFLLSLQLKKKVHGKFSEMLAS